MADLHFFATISVFIFKSVCQHTEQGIRVWFRLGLSPELLNMISPSIAAKRLDDSGRSHARVIRRGLMADGMTEILDGLEESDEVVTVGQLDLRDNDRVNVNHSGPWNK